MHISLKKLISLKERRALFGLSLLFIWLYAALFFSLFQRRITAPEIFQLGTLTDTATLRLQPSVTNVQVNSTFTLDLYLDTNSTPVDGADILINFNPSLSRLDSISTCPISSDPTQCFKTFVPVISETDSQFNSAKVISCANTGQYNTQTCSQGVIEFGGVTFDYSQGTGGDITAPLNGNNLLLARLSFTGLAVGVADFNFEFYPDSYTCPGSNPNCHTVDTNVVTHTSTVVDDILLSVTNTSVAISSGGGTICQVDTTGRIDSEEWMYILNHWGATTTWTIDHTGRLDSEEWMYVLNNWGTSCI